MLWWYAPKDTSKLFFPGLDCQTGAVPDLSAQVDVDHFLAVSSDLHKFQLFRSSWRKVPSYTDFENFQNQNSEVRKYLPAEILPAKYQGTMPQGDFVFDLAEVREGNAPAMRKLPPGAVAK